MAESRLRPAALHFCYPPFGPGGRCLSARKYKWAGFFIDRFFLRVQHSIPIRLFFDTVVFIILFVWLVFFI